VELRSNFLAVFLLVSMFSAMYRSVDLFFSSFTLDPESRTLFWIPLGFALTLGEIGEIEQCTVFDEVTGFKIFFLKSEYSCFLFFMKSWNLLNVSGSDSWFWWSWLLIFLLFFSGDYLDCVKGWLVRDLTPELTEFGSLTFWKWDSFSRMSLRWLTSLWSVSLILLILA